MSKNIVIFGASSLGKKAFYELKSEFAINYFCDNDKNKWETTFCDKKVISPTSLKDLNEVTVIIASMYYKEIAQQLENMQIYNYKIFNYENCNITSLLNLFSDKFYYKKLHNIDRELDLNTISISRVLFFQSYNFEKTLSIAAALKRNKIKTVVVLLDKKINTEIKKYFDEIYNIDDYDKLDLNKYDIIHNSGENKNLTKTLELLNLPVINYVSNRKYLEENVFFDRYFLDIIDDRLNKRENLLLINRKENIPVETFDLGNVLSLVLNYNISRNNLNDTKLLKFSHNDEKVHCAIISNISSDKCKYSYLEDKILELANNEIHVHLYSYVDNEYIDWLVGRSAYIHKEGIPSNKTELIRELSKNDVGLILYNFHSYNEFFINSIVPESTGDFILSGIPIAVEDSQYLTRFVKYNKIGDSIDFNLDIKDQIKKIKNIKYSSKDLVDTISIDNFFEKLIDMYKKIKYDADFKIVSNKKIMINKKQITILIPTRNRPFFVKRLISYFTSMDCDELSIAVYLLDSSDEDKMKENEVNVELINNNNIHHFKYDRSVNFFEKLLSGLKNVNSDVCAICADDDFLCKSYINKSIDILENNNEYVATVGESVCFDSDFSDSYPSVEKLSFCNLESDDFYVRLNDYINQPVQLWYRVFRKKFIHETFEKMLTDEFYSLNLHFKEFLFNFILVSRYKLKSFNIVSNIRIKDIIQWQNFSENFSDAVLDGSFNENCIKCKRILEGNFGISEIDIYEIMKVFLTRLDINSKFLKIKDDGFDLELLKEGFINSKLWTNKIKLKIESSTNNYLE